MFWENWNVFKSILLMAGISAPIILLALWFGGIIGNKKREIALFVLVGILVAAMIVGFILLTLLT